METSPSEEENRAISLFCQAERQVQALKEDAQRRKQAMGSDRRQHQQRLGELLRQLGAQQVCVEAPGGGKLLACEQASRYFKRLSPDLVRQSVEALSDEDLTTEPEALAQALFGHLQRVRTVESTRITVKPVKSQKYACTPLDSEPLRELRQAACHHQELTQQMCGIDKAKRESVCQVQAEHSPAHQLVLGYMDRTNRSYQPISMNEAGEAVRYNIKKRLVSRKPTLKKQELLALLWRSCLEVLDDEEVAGAAERRQRLCSCVVRMLDQEPNVEKLVVRLVRTRQREDGESVVPEADEEDCSDDEQTVVDH